MFWRLPDVDKFIEQYSDLLFLDGTHNTTRYSALKLIPALLVDCLGKTVPVAYFIGREASEDIIAGLKAVGFNSVKVLISDEGGCYGPTAIHLKAKHLLCAYHFQQSAMDKCGGMSKDEKDAFLGDINAVLYHHFNNDDDLLQKIMEMLSKYTKDSNTTAFLQKVRSVRKQVCVTNTRVHFTSSHVSSQRSESFNSNVKQHGGMKAELRSYSIFKLMIHLESLFDTHREESVQAIMKVWAGKIQASKMCCGHQLLCILVG